MTTTVTSIITPAASTPGLVKIAQVVTSGSQSTISFSSIPGSYTDLMLIVSGRDTDTAGTEDLPRLKINGDSSSGNYSNTIYSGALNGTAQSGSIAPTSSGGVPGVIPGTSGNANAVGQFVCYIANYKGTAFHKNIQSVYTDISNSGPNVDTGNISFVWKSAAAITSMLLTASTAFVNGTTATLYGLG